MGIRFLCPNGHKLNVKTFLAGERGICPQCDAKFLVPSESGGQAEAIDEAANESTASALSQSAPAVGAAATPPAPPESSPPEPPTNLNPAASVPPAIASTAPRPEAAEAWYVRTVAGEQYGPASQDVMQGWVAEGRVTVDCWVWKTGWPEWKTGGQAITFLNVVPPDLPANGASNNDAPAIDAPSIDDPNIDDPSAPLPSTGPTPGQLPEATNPTALYQMAKRNREERARKVTLFLGIVVLLLFAVLVVVLMRN